MTEDRSGAFRCCNGCAGRGRSWQLLCIAIERWQCGWHNECSSITGTVAGVSIRTEKKKKKNCYLDYFHREDLAAHSSQSVRQLYTKPLQIVSLNRICPWFPVKKSLVYGTTGKGCREYTTRESGWRVGELVNRRQLICSIIISSSCLAYSCSSSSWLTPVHGDICSRAQIKVHAFTAETWTSEDAVAGSCIFTRTYSVCNHTLLTVKYEAETGGKTFSVQGNIGANLCRWVLMIAPITFVVPALSTEEYIKQLQSRYPALWTRSVQNCID